MNGVLESLTQTEKCCVCGDIADGYHYGVLSCRGCNAFFRRAVTYRMNFACRRGGHCPVDKNARCACRACRLRKCEEVGMDRRAVQPKRECALRCKGSSESSGGSTSYAESAKSYDQSSPYDMFVSSPEFASVSIRDTSFSLSHNSFDQSPSQRLIAWLAEDYKLQRQKRYVLMCNSVEEILSPDQECVLQRPATGSDYAVIFKVQMGLMFEWVNKLPDFRAIENTMDKVKLLRAFALRYLLLDNVFHSIELGSREQIVLVNNSYITPGHIPPFFPGEDPDCRMIKLMMYGDGSFRLVDDLIVPMIDMQFSEAEMMALRLIIFWNPGGIAISEETNRIVQAAGDNAIKELHQWYCDQDFPTIDARLSSLLLLLPAFVKHAQDLMETVKLIPSFGTANELDPSLHCLLRA